MLSGHLSVAMSKKLLCRITRQRRLNRVIRVESEEADCCGI